MSEKTVVAPISNEPVSIPGSAYQTHGSFGIIRQNGQNRSIEWNTCRDRFQAVSEPEGIMDFVMCIKANTRDNITEFIGTVEEVLKLPQEERLQFRSTTSANVIYIQLSPWWKYRVRRSLLTALLRVGQDYLDHSGKGFEATLNSHIYLSDNRYALDRFLSGAWGSRLKKKTQFYGWHQTFHGRTPSQVNDILIKLKKKKPGEEAKAVETQVNGVFST